MWLFKQNTYKTRREPIGPLYNPVLLSHSNSMLDVCGLSQNEYQILNGNLDTVLDGTSSIYDLDNSFADPGWYSDGITKVYWSGTATSQASPCSVFYTVYLSTSGTSDSVCAAVSSEYRLSVLPFSATSVILVTDNVTKAPAEWYSDGTNKAYWDGNVISQFQPCAAQLTITLNSYTDGCLLFTTTGTVPAVLTVQASEDNGVTWSRITGSPVSPRCDVPTPTGPTKYRISSETEPVVYSNEISFTPAVAQDISCYTLGIVNNPMETYECQFTPVNAYSETIEITLRDSAGNPVIADQDYSFVLSFEGRQCGEVTPSVKPIELKILAGNSSESHINYLTRPTDCGQGNCEEETSTFMGVTGLPTQLPNLATCGPVEPVEPTLFSIMLSSSATTNTVCAGTAAQYKSPESTFTATSILYLDDGVTAAPVQWYSDGNTKGYWNGVSMEQMVTCTANEYSYVGVWDRNDPEHVGGGSLTYVDADGASVSRSNFWSDTCTTVISLSVPTDRVGVEPCVPLNIQASLPSNGVGYLDFEGGEPNEIVQLSFLVSEVSEDYQSIGFSAPVDVSILDLANLNRTGTVTLDGNGKARSTYTVLNNAAAFRCVIRIESRGAGLLLPSKRSTTIISQSALV